MFRNTGKNEHVKERHEKCKGPNQTSRIEKNNVWDENNTLMGINRLDSAG